MAMLRRSRRWPRPASTAFAMELLPRITRAQVMDVLSRQANLAGYRAVIDAASEYGRALPMMMTAGRNGSRRQDLHHGRRRRRLAGDRHGAAPRRRRDRHRRAPGDQGAGRIARREIRRGRGRGIQAGRDGGRLRQGNVARIPGQAGGADRLAYRQAGYRGDHRADPGPPRSASDHRRNGAVDAAAARSSSIWRSSAAAIANWPRRANW